MSAQPIITIPDEVLRKKTEKVKTINEEILKIAKDLVDTVKVAKDPEGAGLAAPQIGVSKRICIVRNFFLDPLDEHKILSEDIVLINPKIVSTSKETDIDWEGCLSVPNAYGKVERYSKVKVSAIGIDGKDIRFKASDFLARTIQHEIDHLDGILFTDRVIGKTITERELEKQP
jgi:peptide deformylase